MYKRRESKKEDVDHFFPSIDCISPQVSPLEAGEDSGVNPMTNIYEHRELESQSKQFFPL